MSGVQDALGAEEKERSEAEDDAGEVNGEGPRELLGTVEEVERGVRGIETSVDSLSTSETSTSCLAFPFLLEFVLGGSLAVL
jgi:hypothetical protein